jgi:threonine/homoserine/homoserine lactone efflux protein
MKFRFAVAYGAIPWLLGGVSAIGCYALAMTLLHAERPWWTALFAAFGVWLSYLSVKAFRAPKPEPEDALEPTAQPTEEDPRSLSAEERAIRNILDRPG